MSGSEEEVQKLNEGRKKLPEVVKPYKRNLRAKREIGKSYYYTKEGQWIMEENMKQN